LQRIQKTEAVVFTNGPTCEGAEYSFDDKTMNIALVTVNGRYPENGFVVNEVCKETAYVVSGSGKIVTEGSEPLPVAVGDAVFMAPGEKYYWEGENLTMVMPCSPAFYPEQHQHIA
jgi:mannose-6-phosphate isomerase-like protein (cupin superfamily)